LIIPTLYSLKPRRNSQHTVGHWRETADTSIYDRQTVSIVLVSGGLVGAAADGSPHYLAGVGTAECFTV
jgi:hypothetical protein